MLAVQKTGALFLRIRAAGRLTAADYRCFERDFARAIERRSRPVQLLLDMRGFNGWTPAGFVRDLAWDWRNRRSFSRIAVVGDKRWHRWITIVGRPLFRAPTNFFRDGKKAAAWLSASARS